MVTWRGVRRPVNQQARDAERWTAARLAGVTVAEIARDAGVSPATVSRATATRLPPSRRRGQVPSPAQVRQWADQRRDRVSVTDLARQSGASPVTIRRATQHLGPFPRPRQPPSPPDPSKQQRDGSLVDAQTVRRWVQGRKAGTSTVAIAEDHDITPHQVARATAPYGPFPPPGGHPLDT